jgi:phospholipid/cholesterol/gamma-HCH transport system substrate-binding protein
LPGAARLAGVGVFVATGLLLFAVALFMIGDRQMAFAKKFIIYTEFSRITGLQPGAVIRVAGAKAGSVIQIVPPAGPSGKFRVQLEIVEDLHQLVRTDSVATIETEGLVGGSFLAIATGSDRAAPAPPESTIAGREPFALSDLLQQMGDTIVRINATIEGLQTDLRNAIVSVGHTVDNTNDLIATVSADVKVMTSAGARISKNAAEISETLNRGEGTFGKLMKDDTLYRRATAIAADAEQITSGARQVIEQARKVLNEFQSKDGPAVSLAADLKQTLENARTAMAGFADNMEALKHNFLFRGFFNDRGYFNLASLTPAQYREGLLAGDRKRTVARVWLSSEVLFESDPAMPGGERLSEGGKLRLDSAIAPFLDRVGDGILIIEGYAREGTRDEQYLKSRVRATLARDYLIGKFQLSPTATGIVPLGADASGSPDNGRWDGTALAVFLDRPEGRDMR